MHFRPNKQTIRSWLAVASTTAIGSFVAPMTPLAQGVAPNCNGPFSQTAQIPGNCYMYPSAQSMFNKPLPANVMNHLFQPQNYGITGYTGDQIAQAAITADGQSPVNTIPGMGGFITIGSPASDGTPGEQDNGHPIYFATSSDPWYHFNCTVTTSIKVTFHAPNGAKFTHFALPTANGDSLISIYDQAQGIWVAGYYSGLPKSLPLANGCGSSPATACQFSTSYCSAERPNIDKDWGFNPGNYTVTINGVSESLGGGDDNLPSGATGGYGLPRFESFETAIPHAVPGGGFCTNSQNPNVWPASIAALQCKSSMGLPHGGANYPPNGALMFLDYTPAQITAMNLPPVQKVIVTQMATYGSYYQVTGGSAWQGFIPVAEGMESGLGYIFQTGQQHPFYQWMNGQKFGSPNATVSQQTINCGNNAPPTSQYRCNFYSLYGIPLMPGPGGKDASGRSCAPTTSCPIGSLGCGCDVSGHLHIADPCVAKGLAGVSGGCVTATTPAPPAKPNGLKFP